MCIYLTVASPTCSKMLYQFGGCKMVSLPGLISTFLIINEIESVYMFLSGIMLSLLSNAFPCLLFVFSASFSLSEN